MTGITSANIPHMTNKSKQGIGPALLIIDGYMHSDAQGH
jgi:hypothetical protein